MSYSGDEDFGDEITSELASCLDCGAPADCGRYCSECEAPTRCVVINGETFAVESREYGIGDVFHGEQCDGCGAPEFVVEAHGVRCAGERDSDQPLDGCGMLHRFTTKPARLAVWS